MAAWFSGFFGLVRSTREPGRLSEFEFNGIQLLDLDCFRFICVVGLSSYVAESVLSNVLEDGRVALKLAEYKQAGIDEYNYLDALGSYPWEQFSRFAQRPPDVVRHEVLSSAAVSAGFLQMRIWDAAMEDPWFLVRDSMETQLDELRAAELPATDPTNAKNPGSSPGRLFQAVVTVRYTF